MCGIVGMVRWDGASIDPGMLDAMSRAVGHRGPDDAGSWLGPAVGLGHRRLSIIDVDGPAQPLASVDGRYHIVFNGEIFNYRAVREKLDYPFQTSGDTEVVLAAFALHGVKALELIRGQFAFAIHDAETGRTTLVRDRLGVLPLFYYGRSGALLFASEVKALVAADPLVAALDTSAVASYLLRRYVPAPGTLFKGVTKVLPGHVVQVEADGRIRQWAYWDLPRPDIVISPSPTGAIDLVDAALRTAVSEAMVADVPVGSYLSGGVDSSLVVAIANTQTAEPLHTFCATFGDVRYDEGDFARSVSDLFSTRHHEVLVQPRDFEDLWPTLTWHRDAPISEPADVAVFRLAQRAKDFVKVALSGEGSDEIFGGYPKFRYARATELAGHLPKGLRHGLLTPLERALPPSRNKLRIAVRAMAAGERADRFAMWFAPFSPTEIRHLVGVAPDQPTEPSARDSVDLMSRMDLKAWLPDNLLERGDRMSMAASLELRPPFLDHRVVELGAKLPSALKLRHGEPKWLVKQVARRYLPTSITDRPKLGFKVPFDAWLRAGLQDLTHDLLFSSDSLSTSVLNTAAVRELVASHLSGRRNEEVRLWTLLALEEWSRVCLPTGESCRPGVGARPPG